MNRDNFLELHNISKRFHGVQALKDVDFERF
jgi:ABC-type sugar transport system ATPase subunit